MSEPIREQISAFLDGELPSAETDLLLKRLTRDAELRAYFGRCALIGEACRGAGVTRPMSRGVAARVQIAIEAEAPHTGGVRVRRPMTARLWRHAASGAIAAGVAVIAVFALQQRADTPTLTASTVAGASAAPIAGAAGPRAQSAATFATQSGSAALSYTVPTDLTETPAALPPARLTNYVFAHSEYTSFLGQRGLLSGLIDAPDATLGPPHAANAPASVTSAASAPSIVPPGPANGAASLPGGP